VFSMSGYDPRPIPGFGPGKTGQANICAA
jgi:hypothetical protein